MLVNSPTFSVQSATDGRFQRVLFVLQTNRQGHGLVQSDPPNTSLPWSLWRISPQTMMPFLHGASDHLASSEQPLHRHSLNNGLILGAAFKSQNNKIRGALPTLPLCVPGTLRGFS